jgi:hypothetical protein
MAEGRAYSNLISSAQGMQQMDLPLPRFRSRGYWLAQLAMVCPFCDAATRVAGVALPANHETLEDAEEDQGCGWQTVAANALLFFITQIPRETQGHLRQLAPGFRRTDSGAAGESHWANHCEHCGALLDDQELHCEPGDSFVPITAAQGSQIRLIEFHEPLEASAAGYSLEPEFLPFTPRV